MAHRHNSFILSQMKLKLGSNMIWVKVYLNFVKKADDSIVSVFL